MPTVAITKVRSVFEGKPGDTTKLRFDVKLSEAATQDVTVNYATADSKAKNAAKAGDDYVAKTGTLTIKAGQTAEFIEIDIKGDALKEGDEVFDLILSSPTGAGFAKGDTLSAVGTILDDEKVITLSGGKVIEGKSGDTPKLRFDVKLSEAAAQDVTVNYTTADSKAKNAAKAGDDYVAKTGTLTIKAGQTAEFIEIDIKGDALKEGDEVFDLILSSPSGAGFAKGDTLSAVGTILDDEKVITLSGGKVIEGKSGDTPKLRFDVKLSEAAAQDVTVNYATADSKAKNAAKAGDDYVAKTGTLTIKAGQTADFIEIDIKGDALKEGDEVFDLILSSPTGAGFAKGDTLSAVGTILDDEKVITLSGGKVIEGKSGDTPKLRFDVKLSEAAAQDVTVNYATADSKAKNAAKAGDDYVAKTGTLTIKAGQTAEFIEIDIKGDALKEGDEVFDLILSSPTGAGFAKGDSITAVGTIIDDEPTIYFL